MLMGASLTRQAKNTIWKYSVGGNSWSVVHFLITDDSEQRYIDRVAEGAGISILNMALGFYFCGHLCGYTTPN